MFKNEIVLLGGLGEVRKMSIAIGLPYCWVITVCPSDAGLGNIVSNGGMKVLYPNSGETDMHFLALQKKIFLIQK